MEWVTAVASPAGLGGRVATRHADAAEQLAATRARLREEARLRARAALPLRFLRRLEDRIRESKHDEAGSGPGRLAARVALRFVRPLRKVQDRLFPISPASAPGSVLASGDLASPRATSEVDLAELLASCGPSDVVLLPAAEPWQLESLLGLVPALGVDGPVDSTLHACFRRDDVGVAGLGEVDLESFATRWTTGAPFRHLYLHAVDEEAAVARTAQLGLPVRADDAEPGIGAYGPFATIGAATPSTMTVDRFGPVALQVTALWGRTGSASIFDPQARYLLQRGFLLVRVFVEHWPAYRPEERLKRIGGFAAENFEVVRPHAWTVVERNRDEDYVQRLQNDPEFIAATTLKRMVMLFAEPTMDDPAALAWAARKARVAIVNHLPHVLFTERLTHAPVVFETHDIYTNLLESHGVPEFVPANPVGRAAQLEEETAVFARVAACVNLSSVDHSFVSLYARSSTVVRPYARSRSLVRRSWPQAVQANKLDSRFLGTPVFDVMLWGDWHGGNIKGVQWFVERVVPLYGRLQVARILLVGRVSRGLPEGFAEAHGLLVAGFVDGLDDFILRTKVLLIPDQSGTGISIKAMDAFALGRAFVSTKHGMRDVDCGDTGYAPHTEPVEFGREVVRLLESRAAREESAAVARALYDINFSRAAYSGKWDSVLASVAPQAMADAKPAEGIETEVPPTGAPSTQPERMEAAKDRSPRISIIICTYNRYDVLPDAIESAKAQRLPAGDFEIIIVDNSPDQEAAARWAAEYEADTCVRYWLEPIPGLSNARNVGTEMARSPIVAFMDDDAIASPQWAAEIIAAFDAFPDAGVVGGLVRPRWVGDEGAPWLHEEHLGYLSIVDLGEARRPLKENEWVAGCNIAFRRDVLLEAGGFSRSLGRVGAGASLLSNEETAVSEKIHGMGKVTVYAPAASVEHVIDPARLSREWFRKRAAWQAVSDFIKDPAKTVDYAPRATQHLRQVLRSGTREVPLGAFHTTDDKMVFRQDMGVMYDIIVACLVGGFELGPDAKRPPE